MLQSCEKGHFLLITFFRLFVHIPFYTALLSPICLKANGTGNGSGIPATCPSSAANFFRSFSSLDFERGVEDLMALTLARFLLFALMVKVAVKVGARDFNRPLPKITEMFAVCLV